MKVFKSCRLTSGLGALLLVSAGLVSVSCLHHHGRAVMVAYTDQKRLVLRGDCPQSSDTCSPMAPTEAAEYASEQYDHYRESGFVTLQPEMRLRVVAPIIREGSSQPPVTQTAGATVSSEPLTVKSNPDLLGYETALYNLIPERSGSLSVELEKISVKPVANVNPEVLTRRDWMEGMPKHVFLRLYFQLHHSMKDHVAVLLLADTQGRLNEASGEFEENPDLFCSEPHNDAHCLAFPNFTAVTAELKVYVRKRAVYVPLSATVGEALTAYGDVDPNAVASHLRLARVWNSRLVPLRFDKRSSAILSLPLVTGDRINW
jgi:hypothetical protein